MDRSRELVRQLDAPSPVEPTDTVPVPCIVSDGMMQGEYAVTVTTLDGPVSFFMTSPDSRLRIGAFDSRVQCEVLAEDATHLLVRLPFPSVEGPQTVKVAK